MKKSFLFLILVICCIFQLNCIADETNSSITFNNPNMTYKITHSEKYYCPQTENKNLKYSINDVYSPINNCDVWKNNFFNTFGADFYQSCLDKQAEMKKKVDNGLCDKVVVEKYEKKGAVCEFEVSPKYKKIIGTTCINGDLETMKKEFMKEFGY